MVDDDDGAGCVGVQTAEVAGVGVGAAEMRDRI